VIGIHRETSIIPAHKLALGSTDSAGVPQPVARSCPALIFAGSPGAAAYCPRHLPGL